MGQPLCAIKSGDELVAERESLESNDLSLSINRLDVVGNGHLLV